jgi:hypothetical protein
MFVASTTVTTFQAAAPPAVLRADDVLEAGDVVHLPRPPHRRSLKPHPEKR